MLAVYVAVLLSAINQVSLKGAKMLVALYAIRLGAGPFAMGWLVSMFACFPLVLAVYAGRASDRVGVRRLMVLGSVGTALGLLLPLLVPGLPALFVSAALIGTANIFFHVSVHNLVGSLGDGEARTANFSLFSLGAAVAGLVGPLLVGFVIDGAGYLTAYGVLAAVAVAPALVLLLWRFIPPRPAAARDGTARGVAGLLGNPDLRRAYIASGLILTGIDLFNFYIPIYGTSIGLSASVIGVILGMQAAAAFLVRVLMPGLSRRYGEEQVLTVSLLVAGCTYFLFPLVADPWLLAAISFVLGLGLGCGQPLSIVLTYNHSPPGRAGEALGMRLTVNKFTQIAVPVLFGSLGSVAGVFPVFWGSGSLLLAGGWVNARGKRQADNDNET